MGPNRKKFQDELLRKNWLDNFFNWESLKKIGEFLFGLRRRHSEASRKYSPSEESGIQI